MTDRVYKYAFRIDDRVKVSLPLGARIVHFGEQEIGELVAWAHVSDSAADHVEREFFIVGTGHPLPDFPLAYVATVQSRVGLVWHIFEEMPF